MPRVPETETAVCASVAVVWADRVIRSVPEVHTRRPASAAGATGAAAAPALTASMAAKSLSASMRTVNRAGREP